MKPSCRTTRMHRFLLLTLLLSWQSASATTTSSTTSRSRSWEELQTWIVAMPALVEASTLQNTNDETALRPTTDASTNNTDRRKKHRVKNTNLFDPNQEEENTVSPDPRIINGVAVSLPALPADTNDSQPMHDSHHPLTSHAHIPRRRHPKIVTPTRSPSNTPNNITAAPPSWHPI